MVPVSVHMAQLAWMSLLLCAWTDCSSSPRSDNPPDAGDTDSETDTGVAVIVNEPIQLAYTHSCLGVASVLSGGTLAVGWSDFTTNYLPTEELVVLPWLEFDQIAQASSLALSCDASWASRGIYATNGLLSLTYCRQQATPNGMLQLMRSFDAVLIDGQHVHESTEDHCLGVVNGQEPVDGNGRVIAATLSAIGTSEDPGDGTILFAVDRFGPEGFRETLFSVIYDWSTHAPAAGYAVGRRELPTGTTIMEDGLVSAFSVSDYGSIVFAQATLDGEVVDPPRVAANPPDEYQGLAKDRQTKAASFARKGDSVLGIVQLFGEFGQGHGRYYSVVFDLDGNIAVGPNNLEDLENDTAGTLLHQNDLVQWGDRFAYCYYSDIDESYYLLVLDDTGLPAGEPELLMSEASLGNNPSCSIEVVDQATLAVVLAVTISSGSDLNGPHLVVVTDPALQ
jgi:hypothetical protein